MVFNSFEFGTSTALREWVRVLPGSVVMETIIYFPLDNLSHYGPEASWKSEWTSVISVIIKKEDKLPSSYYAYINRAIVFNTRLKKKKVRLALYFLNVFSGGDSLIINLI